MRKTITGSSRCPRQRLLCCTFVLRCAGGGGIILCKDIRAEEKPVVDVEGLHGVAHTWVNAPPLKEEYELVLVYTDVGDVLERVLDPLTRYLTEIVVLLLLLTRRRDFWRFRTRASVTFFAA